MRELSEEENASKLIAGLLTKHYELNELKLKPISNEKEIIEQVKLKMVQDEEKIAQATQTKEVMTAWRLLPIEERRKILKEKEDAQSK